MRNSSVSRYILTVLVAVTLLMAGAARGPAVEREEGDFENEYSAGLYDEGGAYDDDWYYDTYDTDDVGDHWHDDSNWYDDSPYYTGEYDDTWDDNDWFYDSYDTADNDWWD